MTVGLFGNLLLIFCGTPQFYQFLPAWRQWPKKNPSDSGQKPSDLNLHALHDWPVGVSRAPTVNIRSSASWEGENWKKTPGLGSRVAGNHGLELTCSCQHAHCSGLTTNHAGSAHTSRICSNGAFIHSERGRGEQKPKATTGHRLHRASPGKAASGQVNLALTLSQTTDKTQHKTAQLWGPKENLSVAAQL